MMVGVRDLADARRALDLGVGGIFIGSWTDPALLDALPELHASYPRPFSVSIDAEGGRVVRQPARFGALAAPRELAAGGEGNVLAAAGQLGAGLAAAGVTVDFAPLVDIDGGPADGAIGDRSFGSDPEVVATAAQAFARGLTDAGVQPVFKHFPGHGRATGDSHTGAVEVPPLAQLGEWELKPYARVLAPEALAQTNAAVMVGHLTVPELGPLPATVNPAAYELLREGNYPGGHPFDGVIYTDDLSGMRAIADSYTTPEAVVAALSAGADVALWITTDELPEAIDATIAAVREARYPVTRMQESVRRVAPWALY